MRQNTVWAIRVKRHGKDREFSVNTDNSLFLFALRGLFPVSGRVCGAALGFGLRFGRVNFPGLAPTITAGHFHNRHNGQFLRVNNTNIPAFGGILSGKMQLFSKKCEKLRKNFW